MRPEYRTYLAVASIIILIDQLSKVYINTSYILGETRLVLGDFFRFTFALNAGGAFGLNFGNYWFYLITSSLAIVLIIIYFLKTPDTHKYAKICLAAVIGGAIGNMIDRIFYRKVIDFIDVNIFDIIIPPFTVLSYEFPGFELYRWYLFNIADAAITLGLIGFIIYLVFQEKFEIAMPTETDNIVGDTQNNS
ncbi:MAG: signal peptidase II [candidate division Zixibacteria bacterium]|nr:signal peptidase II [candidate division Zixibacteria bacterium]